MRGIPSKNRVRLLCGIGRCSSRLYALRSWFRTGEGQRFAMLLAVAGILRLILAPFHGFFHDLQSYASWGHLLDQHFLQFYSVAEQAGNVQRHILVYPPNYPPLTIYVFGMLMGLYGAWASLFGVQPTVLLASAPALAVYLKMPMVLADLGTVGFIYGTARHLSSARVALLAAASYAFAPPVLFDGAVWGQTDALFTLALVLALHSVLERRASWAGVLFGLAVLLKPQPLAFAPLLLMYLWRWGGWRAAARCAGAACATVTCLSLPFLLPPQPQMLVFARVLRTSFQSAPYASIDAFNLWWLLGVPGHNETTPYVGSLSPDTLGMVLFACVMGIVALGIWRDSSPSTLYVGAGVVAVAFFDVTVLQRERYLFPALALLLLASLFDKRRSLFYFLAGGTCFLNMVFSVIFFSDAARYGDPSDPGISLDTWRRLVLAHGEYTVLAAAINMGILLMIGILYLRGVQDGKQALVPVVDG